MVLAPLPGSLGMISGTRFHSSDVCLILILRLAPLASRICGSPDRRWINQEMTAAHISAILHAKVGRRMRVCGRADGGSSGPGGRNWTSAAPHASVCELSRMDCAGTRSRVVMSPRRLSLLLTRLPCEWFEERQRAAGHLAGSCHSKGVLEARMSAHDDARTFLEDPVLQQRLAKYMVLQCCRNSMLEDLHAGISPSSAAGDYSDVTVSSPYGVIPWPKVSRLT